MTINTIKKYLSNYAEPESMEIGELPNIYDYVVVIPICDEEVSCLDSIFTNIDKSLSVLLVIIVNSPSTNDKVNNQVNNAIFISSLIKNSDSRARMSDHCQLLTFSTNYDCILVDRNTNGLQINEKSGVGLARKIGCDIALKLYKCGKIKYPWIYSTDADVVLPEDYFEQIHQFEGNYSAVVLDFEHFSNDKLLKELQFYYDFKIRYYHAGLVLAGSTYDYIPLGSTLIADMDCYAQVRGFPKKNAGEDFYLLNKLAKVKPIAYNTQAKKIKIKSRFSSRVPFGTGPALLQINKLHSVNDYLYYHPKCFVLLKKWKNYLSALFSNNEFNFKPPESNELLQLYVFFGCQNVFEKSKKQITSQKRWAQFIHQWFDAFKTLKAVHFFDNKHKRLNLEELLTHKDFAKISTLSLKKLMANHDKV